MSKKKEINRRKFLKSAGMATAGLGLLSTNPINSLSRIRESKNLRKNRISPCEDEGFVSLFDGETLDGWHKNGGMWFVEDGQIVCGRKPNSDKGGILLSDKTYSDFELVLDVFPGWGNDSGVFLRSTPVGESYQVYIDYHDIPNNGGNIGFIYGQQTGGWRTEPFRLYGVFKGDTENSPLIDLKLKDFTPYKGYDEHPLRYACTQEEWLAAWNIGEYNTLRIRCEGKYPIITTWINEIKICKFDAAASQTQSSISRKFSI